MSRIIPFQYLSQLDEFDSALHEDIATALREQIKSALPGDSIYGFLHGRRWHTEPNEDDGNYEDGEIQAHSTEIAISFTDVVDNDLGVLIRYQNQIVSDMMQELMRTMYQTISDSTMKSGNVIDAKGGGFKAEHFAEMLKKIEFGVDRNGNVSFPEIHAGPELFEKMRQELSAQGPEFEVMIQEIIDKKVSAAIDREEERKSKFPSRGDDSQ